MLAKIKKLRKADIVNFFADVRNVGLVIFVIIALLVTWSGIKVVQSNYDLQKQISVMRQENDLKKLANSNLALRNKYLETDQYLELTARKQYNKALPGEKLLVVPKSVALAHTVDIPIQQESNSISIDNEGPWYERNFNAWLDFLFRN